MSVTLITSKGPIKLELECSLAPYASYNFLALCASGAYDGTSFHRVVPEFIIQGGATDEEGGQSIWERPFPDELTHILRFDTRGVLAVASSGPNTGGSQFFITLSPCRQLNDTCTIFGHVIDGWDTVERIGSSPVDEEEQLLSPVIINSTVIHANPFADAETIMELENE